MHICKRSEYRVRGIKIQWTHSKYFHYLILVQSLTVPKNTERTSQLLSELEQDS